MGTDLTHEDVAEMDAELAAAQEELRRCQQDAIALQDRLAEAEALLRELTDIEGPQPGHVMWARKVWAFLGLPDNGSERQFTRAENAASGMCSHCGEGRLFCDREQRKFGAAGKCCPVCDHGPVVPASVALRDAFREGYNYGRDDGDCVGMGLAADGAEAAWDDYTSRHNSRPGDVQ